MWDQVGGLVAFNLDSINWAVGARMPLFEVVSVAGKCVGVRGYGGFLLVWIESFTAVL